MNRMGTLIGAVAVTALCAGLAMAQDIVRGTVLGVEQPVSITDVALGTDVVIHNGQRVDLRDGQYVATGPTETVSASPSTEIVAVAPSTETVTSRRGPLMTATSTTGRVADVDWKTGAIVFDDGVVVDRAPGSAILVDNRPRPLEALAPGMWVTLTTVNPVVSRNGRTVLLNEGFSDRGAAFVSDAEFAGFEADIDSAAMQVQAS